MTGLSKCETLALRWLVVAVSRVSSVSDGMGSTGDSVVVGKVLGGG